MTKRKYIYIIVLLAVSLPMLFSCSDDGETERARVKIEVIPCVPSFVEVSPILTRAWTPPTGYNLYNHEYVNGQYNEQANLIDNTIGIFFTHDGEANPEITSFSYGSDGKWHSLVEINSGTYYFYGFIPYESGVTPSISGSFGTGATLTLNNMPTVTPSDVCVVVGAKNGNSPEDDNGLTTGQFKYETTGSTNHVFLLFDHLYSALNFRIKVDAKYNELRKIMLKKMELIPYSGTSVSRSKTNVTVTLASTTDGTSPITNVTYATVAGSSADSEPVFSSDTGEELKTSELFIRGCFAPQGITDFILRSTYDVYDRNGKNGYTMRQNCVAENKINLASLFTGGISQMSRGTMYNIFMTVNPTYLYMLSEPDLDNPTITITTP